MRFLLILFMALQAGLAMAQTWPDYQSTTVNDYADLLDDDAEARISATLDALRDETGVEMAVLTIERQDLYTYGMVPPPTIEDFATGVFNQWGIGDFRSNDGVLILIARGDREMRIELGEAYAQGWNGHAQMILDRSFLPAFREDRYQDGIEAGVTDTIDSLVRPFLAGEDPPEGAPEVGWFLVGLSALVFIGWPLAGALMKRITRCPACRKRRLRTRRETLRKATKRLGGRERRIVTCGACGYTKTSEVDTPMLKASSPSSFGGGSSGGGGATGRW